MSKLQKHSRPTPREQLVDVQHPQTHGGLTLPSWREGEKRPLGIYKHFPPGGGREPQTASLCGTTPLKATSPTDHTPTRKYRSSSVSIPQVFL
jgi:hypothetical protein